MDVLVVTDLINAAGDAIASFRLSSRPFVATLHCEPKKTWQYILHYNSGKTRSIFIIFALLQAGRNVVHTHEKYIHLT